MASESPSDELTQSLIFWGDGEERAWDDDVDGAWAMLEGLPTGGKGKRQSMYVSLFEDMIKTVLMFESHLFSAHEVQCIKQYRDLNSARYLLVRLCLRKADKWHRLSSLKYEAELGDTILPALEELCGTQARRIRLQAEAEAESAKLKMKIKAKEIEVIDLTLDDDDDNDDKGKASDAAPVTSQSSQLSDVPLPPPPPNYDVFADDASEATLRELLECLTLPELKVIAGQMKVKSTTIRSGIIDALLTSSMKQRTLSFPTTAKSDGKKKNTELRQTHLAFPVVHGRRTQQDRLREIVSQALVQCIRVSEEVVKLFQRINLVYFRNTQYSPTLITPSILARAKKRTYAAYTYNRTSNIWPTRSALLEYEQALQLSAQMDELLAGTNTFGSGPSARGRSKSRRSGTAMTAGSVGPAKRGEGGGEQVIVEAKESPRMLAARGAKEILDKVFPRWLELVKTKVEEGEERPESLRRFDFGHVLTRIVCKGATALSVLKDYQGELRILEALLAQRRWRRGRRGGWHERKALVLHTHMGKDVIILHSAMNACIEGLKDEDTHIVNRLGLERRLTRLEKKLAVPLEERHVCAGSLEKSEEIYITGVRIEHKSTHLVLDADLKVVDPLPSLEKQAEKQAEADQEAIQAGLLGLTTKILKLNSGKSIWKGRDGDEVTVEQLSLQHYENLGYRGFHCEGRIITTLFSLLFWEVIFSPIPGAFETPYQSAPLDIADDTFYTSRRHLMEERLNEVKEGKGPEIVEKTWDMHGQERTFCVGVRWDLFERGDVVEIARCLGGPGLAVICRVLCEDYAKRGSGVPDLVIWNAESNDCKFVEVKGPGDSLSENQKVWIDVMLQAGVSVQVCHVEEEGKSKKRPKLKKTPNSKKAKKTPSSSKAPSTSKRKRKRQAQDEEDDDEAGEESTYMLVESEDDDDEEIKLPLTFKPSKEDADPDELIPVPSVAVPFIPKKRPRSLSPTPSPSGTTALSKVAPSTVITTSPPTMTVGKDIAKSSPLLRPQPQHSPPHQSPCTTRDAAVTRTPKKMKVEVVITSSPMSPMRKKPRVTAASP